MKLTLTIEMDNAAFGDEPGPEAARILAWASKRLAEDLRGWVGGNKLLYLPLRDLNGNTVGELKVE